MMMMVWPHLYNCLAYMAILAKKYFWSNVLRNRKHHEKRLKKTLVVMFSNFWLLTIFKSPLKNITNNIFFCAQNFEHNMDFYIVLTMFHFICLVQHSNIPSKQKNIIPDNNGEKNVSSELAISAQKYPKIVTQEDKKFQSIDRKSVV